MESKQGRHKQTRQAKRQLYLHKGIVVVKRRLTSTHNLNRTISIVNTQCSIYICKNKYFL